MHVVTNLIIGDRNITALNKAAITSSYVQETKVSLYVTQIVFGKV